VSGQTDQLIKPFECLEIAAFLEFDRSDVSESRDLQIEAFVNAISAKGQ